MVVLLLRMILLWLGKDNFMDFSSGRMANECKMFTLFIQRLCSKSALRSLPILAATNCSTWTASNNCLYCFVAICCICQNQSLTSIKWVSFHSDQINFNSKHPQTNNTHLETHRVSMVKWISVTFYFKLLFKKKKKTNKPNKQIKQKRSIVQWRKFRTIRENWRRRAQQKINLQTKL